MWVLLTAALVLVSSVDVVGQSGRGKKKRPKAEAPSKVQLAISRLENLEAELEREPDARRWKKLQLEVKEIRLMLREYVLEADGQPGRDCCPCGPVVPPPVGPPVVQLPPPPPPVVTVEVMSSVAFGNLIRALSSEGFADDKLNVLSTALRGDNWFTVQQVKLILQQFSFPSDKLKALKMVRQRIVDRENAFELFSSFVHSSDKDEARKILEEE
jgi:hypothetical protein